MIFPFLRFTVLRQTRVRCKFRFIFLELYEAIRSARAHRFLSFNCISKRQILELAEMLKTFRVNYFIIQFILILSLILSGISCQSNAKQDDALLAEDKQAMAEITRINRNLATEQPLLPADFESLRKIYEKYPQTEKVRNIYQSALVKREDWVLLEKFINEIPADQRTRADQLNLGKVYLKLGRYEDLIAMFKPLADANPNDADFNSLLGFGYFHLGQNDEAAAYLDRIWETIVSEKRIDEMTTRGLIYFRQKNYPKTIEVLEKAFEIHPLNSTATNTLSRAYTANNNLEKAEEFRKKTAEIHRNAEEFEARSMRNVGLIYDLQTAWTEKKYSEVISLANRILPDAQEKNKPALYQYIAESYKAMGMKTEAEAALKELEKFEK
jgi:tetratricopeptide (TPR) repeat protein